MFIDEKAKGEAPLSREQVHITKLSEAIRIGSKIRPQGTGLYFFAGRSCALGAAYEAVTGNYHESGTGGLPDMVHWMEEHFGLSLSMGGEIAVKNDIDQWPREQIADWLEQQGY
jgi:hypothetical protein